MILNLIKIAGLLFVIGGPVFYRWIWYPVFHNQPSLTATLHARIRRILPVAGGLYLIGVLGQRVIAFRNAGPDTNVVEFFSGVHGLALAALIAVSMLIIGFARLPENLRRGTGLIVLGGAILLVFETATSHAAVDSGWLPGLSQWLHLLAAIVWTGAFGFLIQVPWTPMTSTDALRAQWLAFDHRLSRLVLFMFILVAVTGSILAFVHVHSEAARIYTPYGQALSLKILLSVLLTLALCVHLLRTAPLLKRVSAGQVDPAAAMKKYRRLIGVEAVIVLAVSLGSTTMRGHEPPDTAPFLNPQTLTLPAGLDAVRLAMQPVAGNLNSVRLEIILPASLAGGDTTQVFFGLSLPSTGLDLGRSEALRVSSNSFQGEATFPAPGDWQLRIDISSVTGEPRQLTFSLPVPAQPLVGDISTYFSPKAVFYSNAGLITAAIGLALVLVYGWLVGRAGRDAYPQWALLAAAVGVLFGIYLLFSVALVRTYPSTYDSNPLPLTDTVVGRGQAAYMTACAECHGTSGRGDGRWAVENRGGAIPDLGSSHMDVHTDGEIYWWIVRGIPELDMPPREQELTEDQRWAIVNYVRSLRHGTLGP